MKSRDCYIKVRTIVNQIRSIYASAPFNFVVNGNTFFIYAKLGSRHSEPLDRMINGGTVEAQRGFAVMQDVDEGTFERYVKWSYKGHYTAPDFTSIAGGPCFCRPTML